MASLERNRGAELTMSPELKDRYLLGFDAREPGGHAFNEKDMDAFLFRVDADRVMSCDPLVWPSVFRTNDRPEYVGFFQSLWEDLDNLREQLPSRIRSTQSSDLVAVAVMADLLSQEESERWEKRLKGVSPFPNATEDDGELPHANPSQILGAWRFLGHDVCDEWGLSGLSNCGFRPEIENVSGLRAKWGPRLNRNHLFDSRDDAVDFKGVANRRVKEHAPFFVYGMWLVEQLKVNS